MLEICRFKPEEIDEAIEGLDDLQDIIVPVLLKINGDNMGEQDAETFKRHIILAKHALIMMGSALEAQMRGGAE